ncbi:MAG TPA: Xaa-Pro peptidase family protein [Bacillota bacterium]|nr:Xaa-Pro peptidase family protein [Bacillota bacterium]
MELKLTKKELKSRIEKFIAAMNQSCPDWDTAVIVSRVNQYYFIGTMQDAALFIKKDGAVRYFARRSYERAILESPLADEGVIKPMETYRDAAADIGPQLGNVYIESEVMTAAILDRLAKYFTFERKGALERIIFSIRAVKSPYELALMEKAGSLMNHLLVNVVPALVYEGISEAELAGAVYHEMMKLGHHGITRFFMFQNEMGIGQIGFGESGLYPTAFDGPCGAYGMSAAVPVIGSYQRKLKKGDLFFIDIGFGVEGYHSDKTQVYAFKTKPPEEAVRAQNLCKRILKKAAAELKPGSIPAEIYKNTLAGLTEEERQNFGGFGSRRVKFLGHGIGLHVDGYPVIAEGFSRPLEANMTIALEPKKGIAGIGMVGVEETYIVTPEGGRCITGGCSDIIEIL